MSRFLSRGGVAQELLITNSCCCSNSGLVGGRGLQIFLFCCIPSVKRPAVIPQSPAECVEADSARSLLHVGQSGIKTISAKRQVLEARLSESGPAPPRLQLAAVQGRDGDKGRGGRGVICLALCFVWWCCSGFQADKRSPESPGSLMERPGSVLTLLCVHFLRALQRVLLSEAVRRTFHPSGLVNQGALSDSTEKIK